ncbi:dynein regulatory complex protein 10 [Sardina pilchardus]|uniref:dynein regulatory complex protein 10 n=1 Tax=Sardina pilchardus TaxID=27697 RepID=UPI002E15DA9E
MLSCEGQQQQSVSCSPSKTKIIRDDSHKIVDPSRKKLVSLETQRIAGILDECIRKVEMVALLPIVITQPGLLSVGMDTELSETLSGHWRVGERYETLERQTEDKQIPEAKEKADAAHAVHSSLLDLFRKIQACPTAGRAITNLRDLGTDRNQDLQGLTEGLCELRSVLLERLLTTPAEERERISRMQEMSQRYHSNLELVATLEAEVAAAIKDRDEEISKKNQTIRHLKSSLHQMEKISEDFVARTRQEAEKQNLSEQKTSHGRQQGMQQDVNLLRVQLNNLLVDDRELETGLRKRKYKVETEIENWIQKYDADMGEKQTELEDMAEVFEEEKEELRELEEHYGLLEVEYTQVMEERRLEQQRQEEEERAREVMGRAATVIQAYWRGFRVRKAMRAKAKGKKGKKGKGKKGK